MGIVDTKIGVATCITKTESTNSADSETPVKQLTPSASGRHVDLSQPSLMQETELKQISSSPADGSSGISGGEGLISLHEDDRQLPSRTRDAQRAMRIQQDVNLDSAGTCSNNCVNLLSEFSSRTTDTSSSSTLSQSSTNLLFVCYT